MLTKLLNQLKNLLTAIRWGIGFRSDRTELPAGSTGSASCPPAISADSPTIHPGAGYRVIRIRSPFTIAKPEQQIREVVVTGIRGYHVFVQSVDHHPPAKGQPGLPRFSALITEQLVLPESLETFRQVRDYLRSARLPFQASLDTIAPEPNKSR